MIFIIYASGLTFTQHIRREVKVFLTHVSQGFDDMWTTRQNEMYELDKELGAFCFGKVHVKKESAPKVQREETSETSVMNRMKNLVKKAKEKLSKSNAKKGAGKGSQ
jgi:hypothetical protein